MKKYSKRNKRTKNFSPTLVIMAEFTASHVNFGIGNIARPWPASKEEKMNLLVRYAKRLQKDKCQSSTALPHSSPLEFRIY